MGGLGRVGLAADFTSATWLGTQLARLWGWCWVIQSLGEVVGLTVGLVVGDSVGDTVGEVVGLVVGRFFFWTGLLYEFQTVFQTNCLQTEKFQRAS